MLHWELRKAKCNRDYSIDVEFLDGLTGTVFIKETRLINVFEPLKNIQLFLKGMVKYGAITWEVGDYELDLAPDTMYNEIKNNNGIYVLQ
jgi:hypothetical protein